MCRARLNPRTMEFVTKLDLALAQACDFGMEVSDSSFETDTFLPNLFNFVGKLCDLGISRVFRHARMAMRALQSVA